MSIPLEELVKTLNRLADYDEEETKDHSRRTREISLLIGKKIGIKKAELKILGYCADLHDIGKLIIGVDLIRQACRLNKAQTIQMQSHTVLGAELFSFISSIPWQIPDTVRHHHEHWDGCGYPDKLKGEQIPIFSRIVCIADVWDAISSDRPYRNAMSRKRAIDFMEKHVGWFDPAIYKIWQELMNGNMI